MADACPECGCPYDWRAAIATATAERATKDRLVKAVGEVAVPIVAPAGQHGHRWLARSPGGALPFAVFGLTEDEARTAYAESWAAWAELLVSAHSDGGGADD